MVNQIAEDKTVKNSGSTELYNKLQSLLSEYENKIKKLELTIDEKLSNIQQPVSRNNQWHRHNQMKKKEFSHYSQEKQKQNKQNIKRIPSTNYTTDT